MDDFEDFEEQYANELELINGESAFDSARIVVQLGSSM
jgi:hypothetical protein